MKREHFAAISANDPRASATGIEPGDSPDQDGVLVLPGQLRLHHGGELQDVRVGWRLSGPAGAPVAMALGGISAGRNVCGNSAASRGWWADVVGKGQALDSNRLRILSFDYLGGSGNTVSGDEAPMPSISTYDQAQLALALLNHLGLRALHAFVGASYGGMVGLAFAERYPDRLSRLICISAADRSDPLATGWRAVQRHIVRLGERTGEARAALEIARALAMTTYRSREEFSARFGRQPTLQDGRHVFPVEEYLLSRGGQYASLHRPDAFICLSESIDLHAVDATRIFTPTTLVAVREDQLVPVADMRAMAARLPHAQLSEISSVFGHDAFLKEVAQLRAVFAKALGELP
ncbi:MAG: homoserine O-succinyltransferase [Steroidobacteraceae bacterium]